MCFHESDNITPSVSHSHVLRVREGELEGENYKMWKKVKKRGDICQNRLKRNNIYIYFVLESVTVVCKWDQISVHNPNIQKSDLIERDRQGGHSYLTLQWCLCNGLLQCI